MTFGLSEKAKIVCRVESLKPNHLQFSVIPNGSPICPLLHDHLSCTSPVLHCGQGGIFPPGIFNWHCFASLLIGSHSRQTKGDAKPVPDVGHLAHPLHLLLHLPPHLSLVLVRHSRNKRTDSDTGDASPREYWRNAKESNFSHFCRI